LYVADMYRYMIEHPHWLTPEGRAALLPHYREGDDTGRIYRIVREDSARRAPVRLDRLNTRELVAALDSPNGWQRDKAQQMLLWKNDLSAVAPLDALARDNANPLARLHALCTLDGLGALEPALVKRALSDPHPGVRENALRLAETRGSPEVIAAAVGRVDDPDLKVRMQLAFTLGEWTDSGAGEALGRLAIRHHDDPFLLAAVMTSAVPHGEALVNAAVKAGGVALDALGEPLLNLSLALNRRDLVAELLKPVFADKAGVHSPGQIRAFAAFLDVLASRKTTLNGLADAGSDDVLSKQLQRAERLFATAREIAQGEQHPAGERIAAAGLLGRIPAHRNDALALLSGWLAPRNAPEVQHLALRAMAITGDANVAERVTHAWPAFGPKARQSALDVLLSREAWAFDLLQRIQSGEISAGALDAARRSRLLRHSSQRVRQLAGAVLEGDGALTRRAVVESYRPALALAGDALRGGAVYARLCLQCHARAGQGSDLGPDMISVADHSAEKLLVNILDPNTDIQPGYQAYTCILTDGDELYGLIAAETANSITIRLADGSARTVLRENIVSLHSSYLSLMPEGLEAGLTHQELADLIEFVKTPDAPLPELELSR
jgi:putative heme-binding domain-containing protein